MAVKETKMGPGWIAAGILCLLVLIGMWVIAHKIKDRKMAARLGERIEPLVPLRIDLATGTLPLTLASDRPTPVEHFVLEYGSNPATLSVSDDKGNACVEFTDLRSGDVRRWMELEITFDEPKLETVGMTLRLKPGSPCFGPGRYLLLRKGLTIQLDEETTILVQKVDKKQCWFQVKVGGSVTGLAVGSILQAGAHFVKFEDPPALLISR